MTTAQMDQLIQRTGRSLWRTGVAASLLAMVSLVAAAVLAVIVIDAVFGLNVYGLLALDGVLLGLIGVAAGSVIHRGRQNQAQRRRVAMTIEDRLDIPDNRLVNAVDLSAQTDAGVSRPLRELAIERGEEVAEAATPRGVVDKTPLLRAIKTTITVALVALAFYSLNPAVFHAVLPRLAMPFADLPAYTPLRFEVHVEPGRVYVGKPADIRVAITGPGLAGGASVVFVDDGQKSPGLAMYRDVVSEKNTAVEAGQEEVAEHYTMRVDRVEDDREFYIDTPGGRSKVYRLIADRAPLIEDARVTLKYPAYTGWTDTSRALTGRAIQSLAGTRVEITINSNVPLAGGELRLTGAEDDDPSVMQVEPVVPNAVDDHVAGVGFTLERSGRFELSLAGLDGVPGAESVVGELRVVPDRLPKVDVLSPDRQLVVPEGWPVDVAIGVGDDIGVSGAQVHVGLNDQPTHEAPLELSYRGRNRTAGYADHTIELKGLNATAGDVVKYYAVAADNHPGSPQVTETPVHYAHVITMQQYMDLARSRYRVEDLQREFEGIQDRLAELEAQREALLEAIVDIESQADERGTLTDAQQAAIDKLRASLNQYAQQAEGLAQDLAERSDQASLYEFEEPYKQMLNQLSEQLRAQTEQAESLAEAMEEMGTVGTPESRDAAAQAAETFALMDEPFGQSAAQQTQRSEQDLEKLALASAMIEQGERIRRVALEQAELAVRMSGLADSVTLNPEQQARAEALSQEQAKLREELAEAAEALSVAATEAGEALPNMSAGAMAVVDQIEGLGIVVTQSAAEKAARAGRGGLAHQAALKAADDLDSLLSDTGPAMAGDSDLDGCFNLPRQRMQNAMNQMMAGMNAGVPSMGRQGGQGAGMSGSLAQMSMMGPGVPGPPGQGAEDGARGNRRRAGGGRSGLGEDSGETGDRPEYLQMHSSTTAGESVAARQGVPTEYREQAEAYFRRLAEESRVE